MWRTEQAMAMTETTGAMIYDLSRALEDIHYEPSKCTDEDLEDLQKIKEMVELATKLAQKVAASMTEEE